jgi:UDP-N-acetyl-2-amino-2-deoxyglucuronate dehydrogenase
LIEDFIQAIIEDRKPYIDGREGIKALRLVLDIYHSTRSQKEIIF